MHATALGKMVQAGLTNGKGAGWRSVPILTYHSLDDSGSVISVSPAVFRRQMLALRDWDYEGVPLGRLLDAWEGKSALPRRPVVLTFDDGFANLLDHAAPVLEELGFGATIFAVPGYCGKQNDWPSQPSEIPRLPLLSWPGLRQLAGTGFEIGAHTLTHPVLPALPPSEAEQEIAGSQAALRDGLGQDVTVFAYPYGLASRATRAQVAARYRGACSVVLGAAGSTDDRAWLPRLDMYYFRSEALFRLFPSRLGRAYVRLRAAGRACRNALWGKRATAR